MRGSAMGEKGHVRLGRRMLSLLRVERLFSSIEKPEVRQPAARRPGGRQAKPKKRMMSELLTANTVRMANT